MNVFGVEMWERFSFYGMQGILLLFFVATVAEGGLDIDKGTAAGIVGAYGGAVYLSTIVGAWIADRLLSAERTLFASAVVIMFGHIALALMPGAAGVVIGLVLVAVGSGGLKANATSVVGTLYREGDKRREAGFSLFYLGINLGGFAGPLVTGFLNDTVGFHWGFGSAAIGMGIGLVQYALGRRTLPESARTVPNPLPRSKYAMWIGIAVVGIAAIVALVLTGVITVSNLSAVVIVVVIIAAVAYFTVILSSRSITSTERSRVFAFIPLFIASVAFWSLYQQQFTIVELYADDRTNRSIFGWEMPTPWILSINPVFIILLSGVFAAMWMRMGKRQPSTPVKFAMGTIVMGAAFLLFLPFAGGHGNTTPVLFLTLILLVFTIAELMLSPVGLSVTTVLAPKAFRSQMVALWFLSSSLGTAMSGWLVGFYDEQNEAPYFLILGVIAIVIGLGVWAGAKPIVKLMRGAA